MNSNNELAASKSSMLRAGNWRFVAMPVMISILLLPSIAVSQVIAPQARPDQTQLLSLSPFAIEAGGELEVTATGKQLGGFKSILSAVPIEVVKVEESKATKTQLKIRVSTNFRPGIYPVHFLCKAGLSNPKLLRVESLPCHMESAKAKGTPATAQPLQVPCAVSGVMNAAEYDHYRIEAQRNQRLIIDLEAHRIGSPLIPVLRVFSEKGIELMSESTSTELQPDRRLVVTIPVAGSYYVRVSDRIYQGGKRCHYHLRIGHWKFIERVFPMGGRSGSTVQIMLFGEGLGKESFPVNLNEEYQGWAYRRDIPELSIRMPSRFSIGPYREIMETEDGKPRRIKLPVTINGRLDGKGDRDQYEFDAQSGQPIEFRVISELLGSPMDAVAIIRDAEGNVVNEFDDSPTTSNRFPVVGPATASTTTDDPQFNFSPPSNGRFILEIFDRFGNGGPKCNYRIEAGPPRQDFQLIVQPARAQTLAVAPQNARQRQNQQRVVQQFDGEGCGALSVDRGGRADLVVQVIRRGYVGPITLSVKGLPKGLRALPLSVPANQTSARIPVVAEFDAVSTASFVQVFGEGESTTGKLKRQAMHPIVYSAIPMSVPYLESHDVAVGISDQGAELALRATVLDKAVAGNKARIRVELRRRKGIAGVASIKALQLPQGLTFGELKAGENDLSLEGDLDIALTTTPGIRELRFQATIPQKAPKNKKAPPPIVALAQLRLDITPLVEFAVKKNRVDVPLNGEVEIPIDLQLPKDRKIEVELKHGRLPKGISLAPLKITPEVKAVVVRAGEGARASLLRKFIKLSPRVRIGKIVQELPSVRVAIRITRLEKQESVEGNKEAEMQ